MSEFLDQLKQPDMGGQAAVDHANLMKQLKRCGFMVQADAQLTVTLDSWVAAGTSLWENTPTMDTEGGWSDANGEYTFKEAGLWWLGCEFAFTTNSNSGAIGAMLQVGGSAIAVCTYQSTTTPEQVANVSTLYAASAGDVVKALVYQNRGSGQTTSTNYNRTWFRGFRVAL